MGLCCKGLSIIFIDLDILQEKSCGGDRGKLSLGDLSQMSKQQMLTFSSSDCVHRFQQSIAKVVYIRKLFCETKLKLHYFNFVVV